MTNILDELSGARLFETDRLVCRRWRASDEQALFEVYADEAAARYVDDGQPISRAECQAWLEVTARNYRERNYGMFALEEKVSGRVVGFCGLVHPGGQVEAEVKYAFFKSHWGRGLASEMLPALLEFGYESLGLVRVIATIHEANHASSRVVEKSGMRFIKLVATDDAHRVKYYEWVK